MWCLYPLAGQERAEINEDKWGWVYIEVVDIQSSIIFDIRNLYTACILFITVLTIVIIAGLKSWAAKYLQVIF